MDEFCYHVGTIASLPEALQCVTRIQDILLGLKASNFIVFLDNLSRFVNDNIEYVEDLASNICHIASRNSSMTTLYARFSKEIGSRCNQFPSSLIESIKITDGLLFRQLVELGVLGKNHIRLKVLQDPRFVFFFLDNLNSTSKAVKKALNSGTKRYQRQLKVALNLSDEKRKELGMFGFPISSLEYALKFDNDILLSNFLKQSDIRTARLDLPFYEQFTDRITPLAFAAHFGSEKCFVLLLKNGSTIDNTVCQHAFFGGNLQIIELCITYPFKNVTIFAISALRRDIFEFALQKSDDELFGIRFDEIIASRFYTVIWTFLMNGFDNSSLSDGMTIPHIVASTKQYIFLSLLSDSFNIDQKNDRGQTPLGLAISCCYFKIAKFLVGCGASLNLQWRQDETILFTVCQKSAFGYLGYLIEHGALIDKNLYLMMIENVELAQYLILAGADIDLISFSGNLLHNYIAKRDLVSAQKEVNLLNINSENEAEMTPLLASLVSKNELMSTIFLARPCDVNKADKIGLTPLIVASMYGYFDIATLLINYGAFINAQMHCQITALHVASMNNRQDLVALLLMNGADPTIKDINQKTPIDYTNNEQIRKLLTDKKLITDNNVS